MKRLIGVAAGLVIGLAVSAYADEVRPPQRDLLSRPTVTDEINEAPVVMIVEPPVEDVDLLARTLYWEAGNQDLTGKKLVADVILNRVASPDFPDTLRDVIYQEGQFSITQMLYVSDPPEDCYTAAREEMIDQIDYSILWFDCAGYLPYGTPAYQYGGHFFSR